MPDGEIGENGIVLASTEILTERFDYVRSELGIGRPLLQGHESKMSHFTTMRSIELIGTKVIAALARS